MYMYSTCTTVGFVPCCVSLSLILSVHVYIHNLFITGESTVGRDEECQIPIPVMALSRQHAILLVEGGEHFVQDLGSRNRTYRKGVSVCVCARAWGGQEREREGGGSADCNSDYVDLCPLQGPAQT